MKKSEVILDAALKLFVQYGFHGTPTSKIAEMAGVSNGTLFRYFATKDDLVVGLYIYVKDKLVAAMKNEVDTATDTKEKFRAIFTSSILWALENTEAYFFISQVHFSPHYAMINSGVKTSQAKIHTDVLMEAYDANILKPFDFELLGYIISNQINGTYSYLNDKKLEAEEQLKVIVAMFELNWEMITK